MTENMDKAQKARIEKADAHVAELKSKIVGKKIVDVGYLDDSMYLKLDDETIIECYNSSSCAFLGIKEIVEK